MPVALNCVIRAGAMPALLRLRAVHLRYIQDHASKILFGGPARGADGTPEEMIIVLRGDDLAAAAAFIHAEPYTASGEVFERVTVRTWSQVLPEAAPGALAASVAQAAA